MDDINSLENNFGSHRFGGRISKDVWADHCVTVEKGFLPEDIHNAVKSGEIKIDTRGHNRVGFTKGQSAAQEYFTKEFLSLHEKNLKSVEALPDNGIALDRVYSPIVPGEKLKDDERSYCWDCGQRFYYILVNEKTVAIIDMSYYYDLTKRLTKTDDERWDYKLTDLKLIPMCKLSQMKVTTKIVTEIDLPSGEMVISNHFGAVDEIYESKEHDSINDLLGRIELAKHLATKNVGYGQMGNMSIDVYVNKTGDEIIFGNEYYYDEKNDKEILRKFKGFKHLGSISLSVWRWQCADLETLNKYKFPVPKKLKPNSKIEHNYIDYIRTTVKPGRWVIEHYYDIKPECKNGIYSRLYLKKV